MGQSLCGIIKSRVFRYRYRYGYSISVGALATGIGAEPRIRALHLIWRAALFARASLVRSVVTPKREQNRPDLMRLFEPIPAGVVLASVRRTRNPAHTPDREDAGAVLDEVSGLAGVRPVRVEQQPTERCTTHEMADQRM